MSSPVSISYEPLIQIDRNSPTALYLQVVHQLIGAIQRGYLEGGAQLPGTRALSQLLGLHRKTIVAAYQELEAQGWITALPDKGSFVNPRMPGATRREPNAPGIMEYPKQTGFYFAKRTILNPVEYPVNLPVAFTDGQPDIRLSPTDELARFYAAALRRKTNQKYLGYGSGQSNSFFKIQLSNFLNQTRGLRITPKNILITRGMEMGMFVAAGSLLQKGDLVLVGALSFYTANMIFQQAGAELKAVAVDNEGICVEQVESICKQQPIRMLYIAPHHHYPTTVTLSADRRVALLKLSEQYGFIILEDDYEYDFHYDSRPLPPLLSADSQGMVVYLGSFGKTLPPGFRTGFLIAPENLVAEMQKVQSVIDRQGDSITEQVLGEFISEGDAHRHLKKMQKIYHERRNLFYELLQSRLGRYLQCTKPPGGLAIWTEWLRDINLLRLSRDCLAQGLLLPQMLLYQTKAVSGIRLGFGNFSPDEAVQAIKILEGVVRNSIICKIYDE